MLIQFVVYVFKYVQYVSIASLYGFLAARNTNIIIFY